MDIHQKLRQFANAKFDSIKDFAKALGMEAPSLQVYLRQPDSDSRSSKPGYPILLRLRNLGCDLNWLFDDDDVRTFEDQQKDSSIKEVAKTYDESGTTVKLKQYADESELYYFSLLRKYHYLYIIDSLSCANMSPLLNAGDNVVTDIRIDPESGDLVLCKLKDSITGDFRYIIKYFKEIINDKVAVFTGIDPTISPIYVDVGAIIFVHKIVLIRYPVDGRL